MAEIVHGFGAVGLVANDGIDPEPVEYVFVVVVDGAAPGLPLARRALHGGNAVGGVLQVAPGAAGRVIEPGGDIGHIVAELLGRAQAAARAENIAEIGSEAFIDPKEIILHGLLVVGSGEVGGTAVFAVPRMYVLVGKQAGGEEALLGIDESALAAAAVVGFVMLEAKVRDVIAEAVEEMVVAEMLRAEELLGLVGEALVVIEEFGRGIERGGAVGGKIDFLGRIVAQGNTRKYSPGNHGRIDERGQRNGLEFNFSARVRSVLQPAVASLNFHPAGRRRLAS